MMYKLQPTISKKLTILYMRLDASYKTELKVK